MRRTIEGVLVLTICFVILMLMVVEEELRSKESGFSD